jgi:hypothetical protein
MSPKFIALRVIVLLVFSFFLLKQTVEIVDGSVFSHIDDYITNAIPVILEFMYFLCVFAYKRIVENHAYGMLETDFLQRILRRKQMRTEVAVGYHLILITTPVIF